MNIFKIPIHGAGRQLLVCGIVAFVVYYLADSAMDSLLFDEGTFVGQLLDPHLHEVCIRLLHALFQGIIMFFAWQLFTSRRLVEARLTEVNRELEQANRELETFNYTLAHDLRTPLTALSAASSLLKEQLAGGQADQQQLVCLASIEDSCQRIDRTMAGLLKLSNLSGHHLTRLPVDLSDLAAAALQPLTLSNPERRVEADIAPGLVTEADPELVGVLLDNLIGNAWKFSAGQAVLQLTVGTTGQRKRQVFFVRDNGVGFDMHQAAQLFEPFVRLHNNRQFPGQGIGLATAKRIVARHGGEIWVESAPGQGTTFFFTLHPD